MSIIGNKNDVLKVMEKVNQGKMNEALKLCNINKEVENTNLDIVSNAVEIANKSAGQNLNVGGILVSPQSKSNSVSDAMKEIVDGIKNVAENEVVSSASKISEGVDRLMNFYRKGGFFLREDALEDYATSAVDYAKNIGAYAKDAGVDAMQTIGDYAKDAGDYVVNHATEYAGKIKDYYNDLKLPGQNPSDVQMDGTPNNFMETFKSAWNDWEFKNSSAAQFILNNKMYFAGGLLTATGILAFLIAYKKWKENRSVKPEEIKAAIAPIEVQQESAVAFLRLFEDNEKDSEIDAHRQAQMNQADADADAHYNQAVMNDTDAQMNSVGTDTDADYDQAVMNDTDDQMNQADANVQINQDDTDVNADYDQAVMNDTDDQMNNIGTGIGEMWNDLKDNVVTFFKSIPGMVKECYEKLSGENGITGNQSYIVLIVGALIASLGTYTIYKIYKSKKNKPSTAAKNNISEAFSFVNKFQRGFIRSLSESAEMNSFSKYSEYLDGAVKLNKELFNDKNFIKSKFHNIAEKCLEKQAALYDAILKDA